MRSSDVHYEPRKCHWRGRTEAKKECCQIFQNWCLGGEEDLVVYGVKRCTEIMGNDGGGFASQRKGEYCLKCEEWMFPWNGGGDMLTGTG